MKSAENTHRSWRPPDEAQSTTTTGTHPQKAGDEPGDSLPAAGVPTSTLHRSMTHHPQAKHHP